MKDIHHLSSPVTNDIARNLATDSKTTLHAPDKKEGSFTGFVSALIEAHKFVQNRRSAQGDQH